MATWKAQNDPVGSKELLGRRLFGLAKLAGGESQQNPARLDVRHFQESRDLEFSVDRLGRSNLERQVAKYLNARADYTAQRFTPPRLFNGWATIRAQHLNQPPIGAHRFPVTASPINGSGLDANQYHAHANLPPGLDSLSCALTLRHLFETYGGHHSTEPSAQSNSGQKGWFKRALQQLRHLFHWK